MCSMRSMRSLGLARIGLGALFLLRTTALGRLLHLPAPAPGVPLLGWPGEGARFPIPGPLDLPDAAVAAACLVRTAAAALFALGVWTRPAGLLAGALAYLVAMQEPTAFSMTKHVLFLAVMVLACTDARAELALRPAPPESTRSSLALVRVWIASIYAWAGAAKLNRDWLSGRVLGFWVDEHIVRGPLADAWLRTAGQRALVAPLVAAGEIALAVLLLVRPTRRLGLGAAYAMHALYEVTMAPDLFGWALAFLLLTFVADIGPWREAFGRGTVAIP
jgi:hypothetical protein